MENLNNQLNDNDIIQFFKCNGISIARRFNKIYINKHNPAILDYMYQRFNDISDETPIAEIFYRIEHKIEYHPKCLVCGKPVKFNHGYGSFCSRNCKYSEKGRNIWINKLKETMQERYNVDFTLQSDTLKKQMISNLQEKYGVDNVFQLNNVKEKIVQTSLEKYGVDRPQKHIVIKNKIKNTQYERYYSNTEEAKILKKIKNKKSEATMMKHYGVKHALQNKNLLERMKQNNVAKYGVEYIFHKKDFREKTIKTCIEKYGSMEKFHQYVYDQVFKSLVKK